MLTVHYSHGKNVNAVCGVTCTPECLCRAGKYKGLPVKIRINMCENRKKGGGSRTVPLGLLYVVRRSDEGLTMR